MRTSPLRLELFYLTGAHLADGPGTPPPVAPVVDAPPTTTPKNAPLTNAANTDAPTSGSTSPNQARVTRHMEITIGNGYRRSNAILAEIDHYKSLGLRVTATGEIRGMR